MYAEGINTLSVNVISRCNNQTFPFPFFRLLLTETFCFQHSFFKLSFSLPFDFSASPK